MYSIIIIAVISGLFTLVGTFGGILVLSRFTVYHIKQLEQKVDKHNQVIDKIYRLEQIDASFDEEIKAANHRINDLEGFHSDFLKRK